MAKNMPVNTDGTEEEEIQHVSREELRQSKREAKAAKQAEKDKAEKAKLAQNPEAAKKSQKGKKTDANVKPKLGKRIAKACKEMVSELKKVTWPKWKTVASSTLVVVVIVLAFLVVLTAMDFGLGKLLELLVQKAGV